MKIEVFGHEVCIEDIVDEPSEAEVDDDECDETESEEEPRETNTRMAITPELAANLLVLGIQLIAALTPKRPGERDRKQTERGRKVACRDADSAVEAATLLGVSLDASEDQVRAALRERLVDHRLHPDQGGDPEQAKRFIAAQNLLIERARARRPS
jgi:hypothetical protein